MKNILLIFLSPVLTNPDKSIRETKYQNLTGEPTHTTNESAVRYILQNGAKLDKIFIFASQAVRENPAVNDKTSLQYFQDRLALFTDANTEIFPYNEQSNGTENLKSVAEMAGLIQNFATNAEVTLHVDLTGGMRHVNMIMLDVIRLLEYSGIKIGKLIYSNFQTRRVEEINSIYDLFQLISGVEEFVRFGSVKALKDYYRDKNQSPALKKLVDAMEIFADEIKLCHYGELKKAIENLHDAVKDFAASPDNVQDILMARLIERIRRDYQSLIELRNLDDLRVIRWCVENGYMQQALTLYTERVPEYLGEKNFFTVSDDSRAKISAELKADNRNFNFYLLNNYLEKDENFNTLYKKLAPKIDKLQNKYFSLIKDDALNAIGKQKFDCDSWLLKVQKLLEKFIDDASATFQLDSATFQLEPGDIVCENEKLLRAQLELLVELRKNPQPLFELDLEKWAPFKNLLDYKDGKFKAELEAVADATDRYKKFIDILKKPKDIVRNFIPNIKCAKSPQTFRLFEMIHGGIFTPTIDEKIFLRIMNRYFILKDERNHSNHARADSSDFPTAESLKIFIEAGLAEIEAAKQ